MKAGKIILITSLILFIGFILYMGIGMSYIYPSLKTYSFGINKISFEEKLADRVNSANGWSLKEKDSIKRENEVCYWASIFYEADGEDLVYELMYCFENKELAGNECGRIEVVSIIDFTKKKNNHELPDEDVEELLQILDRAMLNDLAPVCLK